MDITVRLASETVDGRTCWRSECYIDGRFTDASEWTSRPRRAIAAGRDLTISAQSDWAYREAREAVAELYARAV